MLSAAADILAAVALSIELSQTCKSSMDNPQHLTGTFVVKRPVLKLPNNLLAEPYGKDAIRRPAERPQVQIGQDFLCERTQKAVGGLVITGIGLWRRP